MSDAVTRLAELAPDWLARTAALFSRWQIEVREVAAGAAIPGTYWGEPEAGIASGRLWLRADTPVHSALHEGGHLVCMGTRRRNEVTRDAAGDDAEECAVCYLSVLMADALPDYDRLRMFTDMDAWGYSFRLGSAQSWFTHDAHDARQWLLDKGLARVGEQHGKETLNW